MRHQLAAKSYLNVLPLGDDKLDMFAVFNRVHPQISKWAELFYGHSTFETDIHAEFHNADLFRHFYFESKNTLKTKGQQPFGFGFPFLFDATAANTEGGHLSSYLAAPIFIWYLTIKPHPTRRDSWLIAFEDTSAVAVNEFVVEHIKKKYSLDLAAHLSSYVQNRPFSFSGFEIFLRDLASRLGFQMENINPALRELPSLKLAEELAERGDIAWSGALGMFPQQDGSLGETATQDVDFQNFTWTAEHAHEFAPLPEDVYQRTALRTVLRNKITVVEGAHGTGKTHLAANILLNALSNGQKTAVVADDLASLMQIQNEFVNLGIGNLTFLLKDVLHDKKLLLDVLRNEQFNRTVEFKEDDFKITLKKARRLLAKSDDSHDALARPIFGEENFAEVVGHFLKSQRQEGRELLANHLNSSDYEFTKEEYERLRSAISDSQSLYKNVNTLRHPLSNLHPSVFDHENAVEKHHSVVQKLATFTDKFKALHHRCIAAYDGYAQRLMNYYEQHSTEARDQLRHLKEAYSDYHFQYGDDFESSNLLKVSGLYASALFSDRSKNVLTAKDEAVKRYEDLQKIHDARRHFHHDFLKGADKRDFKKLKLNLETYELNLRGWRKALPATVQEELQRLTSKTARHFDAPLADEIFQIETDLDALLDELNDAKLYAEPVSHKMLTLPKRMLFVEETIERLEETSLNLRDFNTFFAWQRHWLAMPENARRLVAALVKVKPSDWSAAFDSWYFYNTLVVHYQSNTLGNDDLMKDMNDTEDHLRTLLPSQIAALWNDKKRAAIREMKAKNPEGFKLFFNTKNQELAKSKFLKEILRGTISTLSDIYPVLLITPQVATQIIEAEGKEFDLVVFDNAQNLDAEQVVPILRNTEGCVLLTEHAESDSDSILKHSFSEKVKAHGAAVVHLNYLHRQLSETTRRINQSVFYPHLDVPFHQPLAEQSVSVRFVSGKFADKTRTNEMEIAEVVEVLKEISASQFNTYPRIGVVTMTAEQRNSLNMNLLNIVQKTTYGWEKIERLQQSGLGIFTADEIAGLQFDILVVSGTFADLEKSSLSKRSFRRLLNSFTKKLIWVNSIPKHELESKSHNRDFEMPFLLSNLILLGEKIEHHHTPQYETTFENLAKLYGKPKTLPHSVFVAEVIEAMHGREGAERLKTNYMIENQLFPLVILPKDNGHYWLKVIRIDGRLSNNATFFNADWERQLLKKLDKSFIEVVSIWSYNWWKNAEAEAEKLAAIIEPLLIIAPEIEPELVAELNDEAEIEENL